MSLYILKQLWALRGPVVTAAIILVLLPMVLSEYRETRCAYVVLVMAVMWLTEAIPISATALLPIFMFPMAGVYGAEDVSKSYINDTSMLFLGGLILAVAVEEWGLHRRVAVGVLRIVGADPKFVMLGMMLPTWFLSMWISNTATASMMIPIANAIAAQMGSVRKDDRRAAAAAASSAPIITISQGHRQPSAPPVERYTFYGDRHDQSKTVEVVNSRAELGLTESGCDAVQMQEFTESVMGVPPPAYIDDVTPEVDVEVEKDPDHELLCKGLSLCVAYGCNIGGIATLTGTPPNLVFKGQADEFFNDRYRNLSMEQIGAGVTFANWMGMALPMSAMALVLAWVLLMFAFLRAKICQKIPVEQKNRVKQVIMQEWKNLGPVTMAEAEVLTLFIFLAIMWISRDPKETPGWATLFIPGYVSDASAVMVIAALLFILPAQIPRVFSLRGPEHTDAPFYQPLLTWEQVHRKLPWGVILLLGGGFALANACKASGLSDWLGAQLASLKSLDAWILNLILCLIVATATEVTSNTATSTLLMPIMAQIALNVGVNPLYLMASAAMATSFAFMLPVATPPNAIVFSYGHLRVFDMASVGLFMNIIAVLVLTLAVNTWGAEIFNFFDLPVIFDKSYNVTRTA